MKRVLSIACLCLAILIMSCNSGSGDPKVVLTRFLEALSHNDMDKAKSLATAGSRSTLDMMSLALKTTSSQKEIFNIDNMQFGEAKTEADVATIPVKEKTSGETIDFTLRKEGGSWKVLFDYSFMMNMVTGKVKELRDRHKANLENVLDEIKHLDIDSLKKTVQ